MKKEVDRLSAQLEEPPAPRTPATIPETQQTTTLAGTRHLRSESSEQATANPRPRKRAAVVPIRPPPEYYGNSRAELHEFIEQCEINFQAEPECYAEDSEKILLARQYLHGRPREDWGLYADRHLAPSWQDFKQCLSNSLPGSANRTQEAMAKYLEARQRADQPAVQFLDYLKRLLPDLPPNFQDADSLRARFLMGLTPESAGVAELLPPGDKSTLEEVALYVTRNEKRARKDKQRENSGASTVRQERRAPAHPPSTTPAPAATTPRPTNPATGVNQYPIRTGAQYPTQETKERRKNEGRCIRCGMLNHMARECVVGWRVQDAQPSSRLVGEASNRSGNEKAQ